jgi:hypothetical protein
MGNPPLTRNCLHFLSLLFCQSQNTTIPSLPVKMLWGPIVFFPLLFRPALGLNGVSFSTECLDGIVTAVTHFTFAGADPDYYKTLCTYDLSVYSMWTAAKLYCKPAEIAAWSAEYQGYCERYRNIRLVPYIEVEPELTDAYIKSLPVVKFEDIDMTKLWNSSILISKSLHEIGQRTIVSDGNHSVPDSYLNID